jgi:hypothetical protein
LPEERAHFPGEFGMDASYALPETREATEFPFLPVPLILEDPLAALLDAHVPIDPPVNVNAFSDMNAQALQARVPHYSDVDLAFDFGNTTAEPAPALGLQEHIPNASTSPSGSNKNISGLANVPVLVMGTNPHGAWANPQFYHGDAVAQGGRVNTDGALRNRTNISIASLRFRGARSPPQTHEDDASRLYHRLIREGADMNTAAVLRDVILAGEVTFAALMAPIQTREMFLAYGGATRMWQLLLEMKQVAPGKEKHHCLLCPVGNQREYKYNRDAVRHFNKNHFGFASLCEYGELIFDESPRMWARLGLGRLIVLDSDNKFFKDSERKIHAKKCKHRPAAGA